MDILQNLETEVLALIARVHDLEAANKRAEERILKVERECIALKEENLSMRQSLDAEQSARKEALARIDVLARLIQEQKDAERFS